MTKSMPSMDFQRAVLMVSGIIMGTFALPVAAQESQAAKPNILLIISEDNGPHFGCYGDQTVPTPHIDRLAATGVRFTNAYVTQAVCSPSRASIYTGLYPHQHGQLGLATHRFTTVGDPPNLPRLMHKAGYRTGLIGKLHVRPESAFPFDFRFNDHDVVSFAHRDVKQTAEIAGQFIRDSEAPFCLTVCYADAHLPFLRQDTGLPKNPVSADDVEMWSAVGVDTKRLRRHLANYYNCISRLDSGIGLLLEELEESGRAEETVVIYVGDHGPQFARGKCTSYELGLRVPLIIRDPRRGGTSGVRDELVSTVDLLPTILEAAGAAVPSHLPGRSLLPLLDGPATQWRQYLFTEWNASHAGVGPLMFNLQRTIRDGRYKLILNVRRGPRNPVEEYYTSQLLVETGPTQKEIDAADASVRRVYETWRESPRVELYDLRTDPHELVNLAERPGLAKVRERLLAELGRWRERTNDPFLDRENIRRMAKELQEQDARVREHGRKAYQPWDYPVYLYGQPIESDG